MWGRDGGGVQHVRRPPPVKLKTSIAVACARCVRTRAIGVVAGGVLMRAYNAGPMPSWGVVDGIRNS